MRSRPSLSSSGVCEGFATTKGPPTSSSTLRCVAPASRGGVVRVADVTNDNFGNNRPDSGSTRYTGNSDSYEGAYDAEPIDAEIVDDYSASGADTEYRGAHRRDDDSEYIEDVDYAAGAGAAAGAAGAAGARYRSRNADDAIYEEPYDEEPKGRGKAAAGGAAEGGLPKRGLAMILIAVAALLALWGIWKITQDGNDGGDGDGEAAAPTSSTVVGTSQAAPAGDGAGSPAAPAPAGDPNAQNTATVTDTVRAQDPNAQDPNAQRPEGAEGQGENGQPAPAPAPAGAPAGAGLDNASAQVYVYNNSGTTDLASRTADQLKGQYNVANNSADAAVMNMPEQVYGVFPETYVFFDPAVPGAEQVAADIARRVGGAARAKGDLPEGATSIPEQAANNSAAVAVVLAG